MPRSKVELFAATRQGPPFLALVWFGVPEEIITDNGKQFTDRFGRIGARNGEVLFDKICRRNGISHRLTAPASPNQNVRVERFHKTCRPDFLAVADPFTSVELAQAAVDDLNSRPHVAHQSADRCRGSTDDLRQRVLPHSA